MLLRHAPIGLGGACRTRRLLQKYPVFSKQGRVQSRLVGSDSSQEAKRFPQTTKKLEPSTSVMYKDAYHNRTFRCCCHGTLGQDYLRPPFLSPSIYTSTKLCFWPSGLFLSSRLRSFLVLSASWHAGSPPGPHTQVSALAEVRGTCLGVQSGKSARGGLPST